MSETLHKLANIRASTVPSFLSLTCTRNVWVHSSAELHDMYMNVLCRFPSGLKSLADYVHSKGEPLFWGIHILPKRACALNHLSSDIHMLREALFQHTDHAAFKPGTHSNRIMKTSGHLCTVFCLELVCNLYCMNSLC